MYKIKFKDEQDKQIYTVYCRTDDLDLRGHPYFVSITCLIQPNHSPIIAIDSIEKKRFQDTRALLIPVSNVILIEKIDDERPRLAKITTPASTKTTTVKTDLDIKKKN